MPKGARDVPVARVGDAVAGEAISTNLLRVRDAGRGTPAGETRGEGLPHLSRPTPHPRVRRMRSRTPHARRAEGGARGGVAEGGQCEG